MTNGRSIQAGSDGTRPSSPDQQAQPDRESGFTPVTDAAREKFGV